MDTKYRRWEKLGNQDKYYLDTTFRRKAKIGGKNMMSKISKFEIKTGILALLSSP